MFFEGNDEEHWMLKDVNLLLMVQLVNQVVQYQVTGMMV